MSNGIFSGFDRGPTDPNTLTMDSFSSSGSSGSSGSGGKKNKFRDALVAASKYKDQTDYKARKEAKEKAAAERQTMKISDDISVMEGYTDPGFTLQGQQGRSLLGPVGAAVGVFNPGLGAGISAVGNLTGY
jgi:hypothetical protein